MTLYRNELPQLGDALFMTDGGLETTLVFRDGIDLPHFAACKLLRSADGEQRLRRYYEGYADIARKYDRGFVLEAVTWRSSPHWAQMLGYDEDTFVNVNRRAISILEEVRNDRQNTQRPMVISACVGPRGDGYDPKRILSAQEAQAYHATQIDLFSETNADMVSAMTITNESEAIGITRAAQNAAMPVVISFTVETDGRLPTGQALRDAITNVDAATEQGPAYYMINCAHPTHFAKALLTGEAWAERVGGLRANASTLSHAELDDATELDDGDPEQLGAQHRQLRAALEHLRVLGGCCGTDERHVEAMLKAWLA